MEIPIRIVGAKTDQQRSITLYGRGYDPKTEMAEGLGKQFDAPSFPVAQIVQFPGQLARLSVERFRFGDVPTRGSTSQVVVLTNVSGALISFEWKLGLFAKCNI